MKLPLFLTLSWAVSCLASMGAGPYQTVYIWYAYQMELQLYGIGNTQILAHCRGSGAGGSCAFDEFLRDLDGNKAQKKTVWKGSTDVGMVTDFDVDSVAKKLVDANYGSYYDLKTLMPAVIPDTGSARPSLGEMMLPIADRVNQVRKDAAARGVDIAARLDKMKLSLDRVLAYRIAEQEARTIPNLKEYMKKQRSMPMYKLVLKDPPPTKPDGTPYDSIDMDRTVADNKALHDSITRGNLLDDMKKFIIGELNLSGKGIKAQLNHYVAINAIQECIGRLNANC
ncbi:hypothetical protein SPBR_07658 [Sporothrix brasiliensis 5110]|uniref:Uncharacterized protein n=1 Tax=Sporothrix brasiliensis 5110 TaxID=1398154 RepID=A0A0C2ESX5_9PEZI|nr:uncharacterized protein SPBR_07658 [Sporothrix brasiliensis 5110]KIH89499.1 hypothetical protein SPBR_07658 [Sporothrix brasiliensis 5110]